MKINRAVSFAALGLFLARGAILPLPAGGETAIKPAAHVTLATLTKVAVKRNPGLKAARLRWKAALEKYPQAKALPDPMIEYTYFEESVETRVGPQRHKIALGQPFPFPGTLKSAAKATLEDIRIAQLVHELTLRNLIVDLKISYHELGYLQRAIRITQQNRSLMKQAVKVAQTLYTKEKATLNDVLKAQSQAAQLEYDELLLRELIEVETANLNALLDRPSKTRIGSVAQPEVRQVKIDYDELEKRVLANRQELTIAMHKVKKADQLIRLARYKRFPKFKLGVGTILTDDAVNPATPGSGDDPVMIGLSMTLPWNLRKNSAAINEARNRRDAAENDRKALENSTRASLKKAWFKLINARRLVTLYEKSLIPQAKKAVQISETWDVDGQKNFSGFIETQSVWLNFNLARLRAATDYLQGLARLERLAGGPLTKESSNGKQ